MCLSTLFCTYPMLSQIWRVSSSAGSPFPTSPEKYETYKRSAGMPYSSVKSRQAIPQASTCIMNYELIQKNAQVLSSIRKIHLLAFLEEQNSSVKEQMFCVRMQSFSWEQNTFCERNVSRGNAIVLREMQSLSWECNRFVKE